MPAAHPHRENEKKYITSLLHGASGFFQILPTVLTLATFMEHRHPVAIAETPRRQVSYHAHVWECTIRMSGSVPCAWSSGYNAHVRGCTMRMVKGIPCSCHGEFWLAHGIRDAGFDVPYSLYIGRCRLMAASFRFRPQVPAMTKWDSPCPHSQTPLSSRPFDTIVCIN